MTEPRKDAGASGSEQLVQELRQVLGRMEVALGLLPDAVVWTNREGRIQWCNGAFDRMSNRPHIEILGADFIRVLPLAPAADHPSERITRGEGRGQARFDFESKLIDVHWESARLEREDVYVFLLRDLTESQKNIEDLEAATREIEAFSYSVAHDLRTPLRHIDGFLQMLHKKVAGKLDDDGNALFDKVTNAAKRLGALIDDLLAFSKTGRSELKKAPVALEALAAEVIEEFKVETRGRKVEWRLSKLPNAQCDAAMIKLVFANLIGNAVKFSRVRDEAFIEIGSAAGSPGELVLFVRDNGVGFDMRFADKLFGVFQRLHRLEDFEGTGIGLANVRRIIAKHGGRTWAEGAVDQGAVFFFSLPAPRTEEAT